VVAKVSGVGQQFVIGDVSVVIGLVRLAVLARVVVKMAARPRCGKSGL
jgi:hypothetical protein